MVEATEGFAAAGGRAGVVVLYTALTDELLDEGLAREVLARLQNLRKELDLGYTETIELSVYGSERVQRIVEADRAHLMKEALCSQLIVAGADDAPAAEQGSSDQVRLQTVKVQGEEVVLELRRGNEGQS